MENLKSVIVQVGYDSDNAILARLTTHFAASESVAVVLLDEGAGPQVAWDYRRFPVTELEYCALDAADFTLSVPGQTPWDIWTQATDAVRKYEVVVH